MLLSPINTNQCGRWQKIRLIFNAIGCCNFGTIPAGTRPSCTNVLSLKFCGCIYPIPSPHLQLCQFNQTAAISSTTKSLTKAATATGNKQQKQQNEADKPQHLQLAKASIAIGPNRKIEIECRQGVRGHRIIQISRLPNIPVPRDAYKFVAALDRLIGQLPVENSERNKLLRPILARQMLEDGQNYNFQLSVLWFELGRQWHLNIRSVKTVQEHNEKGVQIPLWTLPLLRQKMATILEKLDGTQRIGKMPTMPEWATEKVEREEDAENNEGNGQSESGNVDSAKVTPPPPPCNPNCPVLKEILKKLVETDKKHAEYRDETDKKFTEYDKRITALEILASYSPIRERLKKMTKNNKKAKYECTKITGGKPAVNKLYEKFCDLVHKATIPEGGKYVFSEANFDDPDELMAFKDFCELKLKPKNIPFSFVK